MSEAKISLLSWNILGPAVQDVTHYGFKHNDYKRLELVFKVLQQHDADVVCLQEIDATSLEFFNQHMQYAYRFASYHSKGQNGGVVVYVKNSVFDLKSVDQIALSNVSEHARGAAALAVVRHKNTGFDLLVSSVHLNKSSGYRERMSGVLQVQSLAHHMKQLGVQRMIVAGDFNTMYADMQQDIVTVLSEQVHQSFEIFAHQSCTAGTAQGFFTSIDHVLYANVVIDMQTSSVGHGRYLFPAMVSAQTSLKNKNFDPIYKVYPSDHAPVYVEFFL